MRKIERPSNRELRDLLLKARALIARYDTSFLCIALRRSTPGGGGDTWACRYLTSYIQNVLEGNRSLEGWCRSNNLLNALTLFDNYGARLAWIDWMLEGLGD